MVSGRRACLLVGADSNPNISCKLAQLHIFERHPNGENLMCSLSFQQSIHFQKVYSSEHFF